MTQSSGPDRKRLDYSGFQPDGESDPDLIRPYTDALADDRIEHLFESMPNTVRSVKMSFRSETGYGQAGRLIDLGADVVEEDYSLVDYIAEGDFTADTLNLKLKTFYGDTPQTLNVVSSPDPKVFDAFTDDSFDIHELTEDQIVELSIRASDNPPDLQPAEHATGIIRPSFPLMIGEFWRSLAQRNQGLITESKYLEVPFDSPTVARTSYFGRLLQEEIDKPFSTIQRLVIEYAIMHEELDAEEVVRLELTYTWAKDPTQKTQLVRSIRSGIDPTTTHLRIARTSVDGKDQVLDPSDPQYLTQFQQLLDYMIETSTK